MEADFAVDRTIIVEFGPSISGDGVHLVGALPSEVGGIGKEGAIEAADHASELELTEPVSLELDVGRTSRNASCINDGTVGDEHSEGKCARPGLPLAIAGRAILRSRAWPLPSRTP